MMWKKKILMLMSIVLIVSMIAGCSNRSKKEKEKVVAMGRYEEKTIEMPDAVKSGDEIAFLMKKNPQGSIEIYSCLMKAKKGEYTVRYTLNKDNSWTRAVPRWLNERKGDIDGVAYGKDGTMYAIWSKNINRDKVAVKILKSTDGQKSEELNFEEYNKSVGYNRRPNEIEVLDDNSILLNFYNTWTLYKDNKPVDSFKVGDYKYARNGNTLFATNEKQNACIQIDVNSGKTLSEIPVVDKSSMGVFATDKDGNWEMASETGIHRMAKGGNCWETILDGALASMSMPSLSIDSILNGDKDDYYILYESGNGYREIKHYVYNKNIPTTPSKTLSIVSLEENPTVRQAIVNFQHEDQDVKVDYKVLMDDEDGTTVSDHIKQINTELLAGKGSDILILDNMPVQSYIEKGVLEDISDVINPLRKNKEILPNIIDNYNREGKIYSAPLRYNITYAFGNKEAVGATKSIESLAKYANESAKVPLFDSNNLTMKDLLTKLYCYYSNSFVQDRSIDKEGLRTFLNSVKTIADQSKIKNGETNEDIQNEDNYFNDITCESLYEKKSLLGLTDVSYMYGIFAPIRVLDEVGGEYSTINNEFIPSGLVGLNHASKEKKLAKDFIHMLYGLKVQKAELGDGFPVNIQALENFGLAYDDFVLGMGNQEITQPSKEKMQKILELCKYVTVPVTNDHILLDMILKESNDYLCGKAELETTVDRIMEKTKAYLNE